MSEENSTRIQKLESHVAHLERQIDQLNEVAIQQSKEIERVKKLLNRVSQSVESAELDRIKSVDSKPPHYQ
jgi:uncharacterized coiled-coil protein SlyX